MSVNLNQGLINYIFLGNPSYCVCYPDSKLSEAKEIYNKINKIFPLKLHKICKEITGEGILYYKVSDQQIVYLINMSSNCCDVLSNSLIEEIEYLVYHSEDIVDVDKTKIELIYNKFQSQKDFFLLKESHHIKKEPDFIINDILDIKDCPEKSVINSNSYYLENRSKFDRLIWWRLTKLVFVFVCLLIAIILFIITPLVYNSGKYFTQKNSTNTTE